MTNASAVNKERAVCWTDLTQVRSMPENFVRSGPRESAAQATPAHKSLLNPGSSQDPRSALGSHSALKPCVGNENGKRLSEDTWKGARPICATFTAAARCAALGSSGYRKPLRKGLRRVRLMPTHGCLLHRCCTWNGDRDAGLALAREHIIMETAGDSRSTRPSGAWFVEKRAKPAHTRQAGCMLHMANDCESHMQRNSGKNKP